MNARLDRCDHKQIDAFLASDPDELKDAPLFAHLDVCSDCRDYMERSAADSQSWSDAAACLLASEFDRSSSIEYSAASMDFGKPDVPTSIQNVLDSLAPSDDPHRLGRLGGYEISGVIGVGGMGVVLKAVDTALDRIVAIKVMAPHLASHATARKRFAREAKAAAAVLHPNVIPIHSVSSEGATPYLVMGYVRGGSLQKRLDREGILATVEILRIGSQIAAGLSAAHEQGLVHRDIKPENILLEEGVERVTLTDFGLARAVDDASVTREGTIAGTPQYMSPEQARGESVDQQSDLFSLGSVLYALCTGRPPFRAESSYAVMRKISDESPIPIRELTPDIPDWLCAIIRKLMAKDKADRFATAHEVHELLEACLGYAQQPTVNRLPSIPGMLTPKIKTSFLKSSTGVLLMVFLMSLLAFAGFMILPTEPAARNPAEAVSESFTVSEPLHFERLCRLRVAYHTRYEAIVKSIHNEATSTAAANDFADLLPLVCEKRYLERMLRRYQLGPEEQALQRETEKKIKAINQNIVATTLKVRDEPYFDIFGRKFKEVQDESRSMEPFSVNKGHAQHSDDPQFVVWMPAGAVGEIDLSDETGKLEVLVVNQSTGELSRQREYVDCSGLVGLPSSGSKLGTLCWLRPVAGPIKDEPVADDPQSLTWKDVFGSEPPANYPTDALSLIGALNASRGEWVFAGKAHRDNSESEFEASMEIRGGVREFLRQDSFPQWIITIDWPRESPTDRFLFNIMAMPEPTGIKWMVAPYFVENKGKPVSGKFPIYEGAWDAEKATIVWTSKQMRSPLKKDAPTDEPVESQLTFQMDLKPNGEIRISGYQHDDSFRFSGHSAARIGEPYVEPDLNRLTLPNGYKVFFASRLQVMLVDSRGGGVAGARLEKIGCHKDIIYGLITKREGIDEPEDTLGYFWMDSATGEITKGMELGPWSETLREKGVNDPQLLNP